MNLYYVLFVVTWLLLHAVVNVIFLVLYPYVMLTDPLHRRLVFKVFWFYNRCVTSLFFHTKLTGYSLDDIEEPVIFVCNHQTLWDHVFCFLLGKHNPRTMMKASIRFYPLVGLTVRVIDSIFVYPRKPNALKDPRNVEALHKAENLLRQGVSLQIFPEGTRRWKQQREYATFNVHSGGSPSENEELVRIVEQATDEDPTSIGYFKIGAFKLAMDTGVKVVPLVMEMRHLINDQQLRAQRGTMRLHALEPVDPKQFRDVESLANHVHKVMQDQFRIIVSEVDAPLMLNETNERQPVK